MPGRAAVVTRSKRAAVAAPRPTISSSTSWLRLSLFVTACLSGGFSPAGSLLRLPGGASIVAAAATDLASAAAAAASGEGKSDHPRATPDALLRHYRPFSFGWMKGLVTDKAGCSDWRTVGYSWRPEADFASNMSNLLSTWVYAIAGRQRENLVIVDGEGHFDGIVCERESDGVVQSGYACIWEPVPHVCFHRNEEDWGEFMRSRGAGDIDVRSATGLTFDSVRASMETHGDEWLQRFGIDEFVARQALSRLFLWNSAQPWLKGDVRDVLMSSPDEVRRGPFIVLHIEKAGAAYRGPPINVETYVSRARDHLLTDQGAILSESVGSDTEKTWNEPERIWTDSDEDLNSIRGVWVISDDPEVFEQVRRLAPLYFPGVKASRGVVNGWSSKWKGAHVAKQTYSSIVYALADLVQLSRAQVVVGTANNDMDDMAALLRSGNGKSRDSYISIDAS